MARRPAGLGFLLAGLTNALKLVGKDICGVRIVMIGMGAANVAIYRLLTARGIDPKAIIACDSKGTLHKRRHDIEELQADYVDKWRVCVETNEADIVGGPAEAFRGADVCIAFSSPGPGVIDPAWVETMAADAIVLACANPIPEIWPWEAEAAGARIVAPGRSDFPNQMNNSLAFPGIFRGALDVRARTITDGMVMAAAQALAGCAEEQGIHDSHILPRMDEWEAAAQIAAATGEMAQKEGIASVAARSREALFATARETILKAREAMAVLMRENIVPPIPPAPAAS